VKLVRYRVRMELLPDGRLVDRTIRSGWGELQVAALAAVDLIEKDPGARIRTLSVEVIDEGQGDPKSDLFDPVGTGEKY
jgi:membrane protein involved in colicin uptake